MPDPLPLICAVLSSTNNDHFLQQLHMPLALQMQPLIEHNAPCPSIFQCTEQATGSACDIGDRFVLYCHPAMVGDSGYINTAEEEDKRYTGKREGVGEGKGV